MRDSVASRPGFWFVAPANIDELLDLKTMLMAYESGYNSQAQTFGRMMVKMNLEPNLLVQRQ